MEFERLQAYLDSGSLIVFLDFNMVLDGFYPFRCMRNRMGFIRGCFGWGGAAQPYIAIVVRINFYVREAGHFLFGQLGFYLGGYYRILDKSLGVRSGV